MSEEVKFSAEEIAKLNDDVKKAEEKLSVKKEEPMDAEKLKAEVREQIMAEIKAKEVAQQEANEKEDLKTQLEAQKDAAAKELQSLKDKIDSMAESKAVVNIKSPFKKEDMTVETLMEDKEQLAAIEEASKEEFFKQRGN